MQDVPTTHPSALGRSRRSYRALLATSVFLAALGAPVFMQGTVVLVRSLTADPTAPPVGVSALLFVLSAVPLALAGLFWRRTKATYESLGEDD